MLLRILMGCNMNNTTRKKLTRKEMIRKRKRERRLYVLTAVVATFCVFAIIGVVVLLDRNSDNSNQGNWILAEGDVEIAPPAAQQVDLDITTTEEPALPSADETAADDAETDDIEADGFAGAEDTHEFSFEYVEATAEPEEETFAVIPEMPTLEAETERQLITISAAGDFTLGGDYNTTAHERFDGYVDKYGTDYFLQNVRPIFEADDLTFINLEGPLTNSNDKRSGRTFNFKGDPAYAAILSGSSVELAGLANNHALDFGKGGLHETADVLEAAGVGYCGYSTTWYGEVEGFRVACLSVTEWDYTTDELAVMVGEARAESDLVIVMIHWGEEKGYDPTSTQEKYGHALIDAGADLVLGSHPHVVSGVELYNGKYIVYSLGNFCFGGNKNPSDKDSMIFQQTFELLPDGTIADAGVNIIPCCISSTEGTNDYCPVPLTGTEASRVIRKISVYSDIDMEKAVWADEMEAYFAETK